MYNNDKKKQAVEDFGVKEKIATPVGRSIIMAKSCNSSDTIVKAFPDTAHIFVKSTSRNESED